MTAEAGECRGNVPDWHSLLSHKAESQTIGSTSNKYLDDLLRFLKIHGIGGHLCHTYVCAEK
jgi:hypothetical protein